MSKNNSIDDLFKRHKVQAERPPSEEIWKRLEKKLENKHNQPRRRLLPFSSQWTTIAAVFLLLLLPATYILITTNKHDIAQNSPVKESVADNQVTGSQPIPEADTNNILPDNEEIADASISKSQKPITPKTTPPAPVAAAAQKQVTPKPMAIPQNEPAAVPKDHFAQDVEAQNNPTVPKDHFGRDIAGQVNQPTSNRPASTKPTTALPESEHVTELKPSAAAPAQAKKEIKDSNWSAVPTDDEIDIKNWNTPEKFASFLQNYANRQTVSVKPIAADFVKTAHKKALVALLQQSNKAPFVVRKGNSDSFPASSTVGNEVLVLLYCMKQKTQYPPQQRTAEMMPTPENIAQMRKWAEK